MNDMLDRANLASAVLTRLPTSIANTLVEDRGVREAYGLKIDPSLMLGNSDVTISRSIFFNAIATLLGPGSPPQVLTDSNGTAWTLEIREPTGDRQIIMRSSTRILELPSFWSLSPDALERLGRLEHAVSSVNLPADSAAHWRSALAGHPISHDDYARLESDLSDTPVAAATRIAAAMQSGPCPTSTLVPTSITYYERFLGPSAPNLDEYASICRRTTDQLIAWSREKGLKLALLLSAHSTIVAGIDAASMSQNELAAVFEWLIDQGDTISQVGAIELALPILDRHEYLEPLVAHLARKILDDDPGQESSRSTRLSNLMIFVAGELARTQILRGRPPFWKRLAAIAQASLIERQALEAGGDASKFADTLRRSTGRLFWLEAMADLRTEPRWLPDFVSPSQLRIELVSRVAQAAIANDAKIRSDDLRKVLLGATDSIGSSLDPISSFLPGPLEGGRHPQNPMPSEVRETIEANLASDQLTSKSFTALVNSALIFQVGPELPSLAAEALKRVKYQLRQNLDRDLAYGLTYGLAVVAAVSRSSELANQVRILARVIRRRPTPLLGTDEEVEIALVTSASHEDAGAWAAFLGEWMTEVALEPIHANRAATLRTGLRQLRVFVPELLRTLARADAALASVAP